MNDDAKMKETIATCTIEVLKDGAKALCMMGVTLSEAPNEIRRMTHLTEIGDICDSFVQLIYRMEVEHYDRMLLVCDEIERPEIMASRARAERTYREYETDALPHLKEAHKALEEEKSRRPVTFTPPNGKSN
jgi:hypothetical protein